MRFCFKIYLLRLQNLTWMFLALTLVPGPREKWFKSKKPLCLIDEQKVEFWHCYLVFLFHCSCCCCRNHCVRHHLQQLFWDWAMTRIDVIRTSLVKKKILVYVTNAAHVQKYSLTNLAEETNNLRITSWVTKSFLRLRCIWSTISWVSFIS